MPIINVASGLGAQLVATAETTYGVAPSLATARSYEFKNETMELKKTAVQGEGLADGRVYQRTKRRVLTQYDVSGAVTMNVPTRQLAFWIQFMLGDFAQTPTQIAATGIYKSVFRPTGNFTGHSFTLQKGVPAADNAVSEPITYVGNKLSSWDLKVATGAIAEMTLNITGRNELAGAGNGDPLNASVPALAAFGTPTSGLGTSYFHFRQATLFTGGTPTLTGSITTPTAPVPTTTTTTGTILAGVYQVIITYVNAFGETLGSTAGSVTTTGSTSTITVPSPGASGGATGWYAYVTQVGGSVFTRQQAGAATNIGTGLTLTAPPTSTGVNPPINNTTGIVSLASAATAASVKEVDIQQSFALDDARFFLGNNGFKGEPIENGYRGISGSFMAEWQSNEAYYNAFAADTTTSLQLTLTGASVSTSNYLLDIIIPNIKLEGESPKVGGPEVVTQSLNFVGLDDEATYPIQITYQSEDTAI